MKILPKRRRLENKTNYTKRRRLLEMGKNRIVVRKSNKYILIQYVETKQAQDSVKICVLSKELLGYGWPQEKIGSLKSLGAAYLTGLLFGNKIKSLPLPIIDTGLIRNTKGSRIYASLKGIIDAGVKIKCDPKVIPEEARIRKTDLNEFFDKVKNKINTK
jgi:large subunit ribosomal protein L18